MSEKMFAGLARTTLAGKLLAALMVFLACTSLAESRDIKLATGPDYAPYTSPDLPNGGIISEIVSTVFAHSGYTPQLTFHPWKRVYNMVLHAESDATFPYAWSEERARDFHYSRPINKVTTRVFSHRAGGLQFRHPKDLAGMLYCQPLGYQTEPELTKMIENGDLQRHKGADMDECFRLLGAKRVDFVVSNDLVAWTAANRIFPGEAEQHVIAAEIPFREIREYLIVSRQHPQGAQLIEAFNETYEKLLAEGLLDDIWRARLGNYAKAVF